MKKIFFLALLVILCIEPADAQRRRTKKKAVVKEEEVIPEKTPEEELFEELLPSTAKVMFIDSLVVDKDSFLTHLTFAREMGRIAIDGERVSYTNEFANTTIFASGEDINDRSLFITHKYGERWDKPTRLYELGHAGNDYPFLMTDGVTLYFSAEGKGTIGGKDIFRTTFNSEESHFYEAVNMGMPFNSTANDYLLAISDYDNLGWLVSDRYQPEGKVCIYTFEPTLQRKTFDDDPEPEQLMAYAKLNRIEDTWEFGNRKAALSRKLDMLERIQNRHEENRIYFVVNDDVTYTKITDFKRPEDVTTYQQILACRARLEQTQKLLQLTRDSYSDTPKNKRENIGRNILELEEEEENLENTIKFAEKKLRNSLNK